MAKYSLTEQQKDMLRSIVPGLESGSPKIESEWNCVGLGVAILAIDGLDNKNIWRRAWTQVTEADFDDFVDNGFFKYNYKGYKSYTLNAQKIIDAVKSNFGENETVNSNGKANSITFSPLFGSPATISQYKADIFVMMPFKPEMKHVYDDCMKPVAKSLSLTINRGDDFFTKNTIMTDIWSAICHCRLVIADCTDKNANVFYELGMTHTVGKPVILLAQKSEDISFDVHHYRHIIYSDTPEGLVKLMDDLKTAMLKVLAT